MTIEKVVFPMKVRRIVQDQLGTTSHVNRHAWDLGGEKSSSNFEEEAYAPTTCKIISMGTTSSDKESNTIYFGTCDDNGNKKAVLCSDGSVRVLTYALTHCNDSFKSTLQLNKIFKTGSLFYK